MSNEKQVRKVAKKKGVSLKASCKELDEEDLNETTNLLEKSFNKTMKWFNSRPYTAGDNLSCNDRRFDSWKKNNKILGASNSSSQQNQQNQDKGIQWRECEDFGHIQVQCPNYVKKQNKSYYATHSDEDSNEDELGDNVNNFVAFTAQVPGEGSVNPSMSHIQSDNISDDEEDLTEEELKVNY
ncbi:hypothetical protein LIER_10293 [Lithospermum erythrorhizon]|uniref:Gag-pol polyprotein n=1 Tax=Lithospermum erythrorhizon TaxID=34254 RepID=A0AAV3PK57_LITER